MRSFSCMNRILPREEELEEVESVSESERSTEAAHKFLITKGKRLNRQHADEEEQAEMHRPGGGQAGSAAHAAATRQSRRKSSVAARHASKSSLQALRDSLNEADKVEGQGDGSCLSSLQVTEKIPALKAVSRKELRKR